MATVTVESCGSGEFRVRVRESKSETTHIVTVADADYQRLTSGRIPADELVRRSFEFLLEREPKESILSRFDLRVIARYFPEYDDDMRRRLAG
jgi:hypothetical protein